jgi:PAS domain S-box-containing protein
MTAVTELADPAVVPVRLLIIDDDDVDRERVVRLVDNSGIHAEITLAGSSREALALLRDREFDCIVLDNQMPDGTGAELLARLHADVDARVPVIMVTGAGDEELAAEVMRSGAADYLPKSRLSADNLFRAISRSVERSRLQQQLDRYAAELAVSEAKYRAIVEDQTELVSLADPDLTLSYVNMAYAAHYGLAPEQIIGRNLLEFLPAGERDQVAAQMRILCRRKSVERSENRTVSAIANVWRWVSWTHRAIVDKLGSVASIHSVGRDITDQVDGREAVARLAAVVNCSVDAMVSTDLHGIVTTWNPAAERLFDHTTSHIVGKPIGMIVPPDREVEERTLTERVRKGESIVEFETVRLRRNGTLTEVALTFSPIRDAHGKIRGISQIARDVRGRKRLERALLDSERLYRDLYEASPAMLHSIDMSGRVLSVSNAWLARTGYLRSEILGRSFADFLAEPGRQTAQEGILQELARVGRVREVGLRMVRCDGSLINVVLSATLERDASGNPQRALAVLRDAATTDPEVP